MATPTLRQARSLYATQQRLTVAAVAAVRRLFARSRPLSEVVATVAAFQYASATASTQAVAGMADSQTAATSAAAFMGVSSFGFPVSEPIVATIDRFVPAPLEPLPANWWTETEAFMGALEQLIASEVADAGRSAAQVEFVDRPEWTNYVRMLTPPSCARCAILAGRIYRDLDAFQRHPQCFPAGTVVSGPGARGATRRWHEGELVVIRTAGGKELSATANHPVLTDQGWVPANLLTEGGYVVSRASGDRSRALLVPDHDQVPSRIEDVWGADSMGALGRVPVAPEDFHGDGFGSSHVDVVLADGLLRNREQIARLQQDGELVLAFGAVPPVSLDVPSALQELSRGGLPTTASVMRSLGLRATGGRIHHSRPQQSGLTRSADILAGLDKSAAHHFARDPKSKRERVLALAGAVGGHDRSVVDRDATTSRWDAPGGEFSTENRAGYAERGADLRERLAGQVELDRIVELRRIGFAGHVYNLTSSEGWYDANGLIVSNCDCVMVPVESWQAAHDEGLVASPDQAFRDGQVRGLSKADAKAIADGADMAQVVNAAQGMAEATAFGRRVKATTTGTTRRAAWRRANPTRLVRLRPESIYEFARDREDAIRLLRLYGYIS